MAKKKSRRGRPRVNSSAVQVRMLDTEIAQVDAWMKRHLPEGTRPMAIRWLVEIGLGRATPIGRRSPKAAAKALQLAGREIERVVDKSAPAAEQAKRKRRLLKGPREFRRMRKD